MEASMDALNIGELARSVGINTSAIRYYESIGLLPKPPRQSGWRKYDPAIVDRLKVIHTAREVGFSLEEIHTLLYRFLKTAQPSSRWQKLARRKLPELNAIIERATALKFLIEAGLDCDCEDIALCINSEGKACRPKSRTIPLSEIKTT
jgi:MerR family transcriptional regulator, redox-sensitive transcriptional activator SoxR